MKAFVLLLMTLLLAPAANAQETIALAVEGWQQQDGSDGVVYYRCASPICASGSTVSYKAQPHRTALTLAEFDAHHRGLAERNTGTTRIRTAKVSNPQERTTGGVRVMQIDREVVWAEGRTTYTIEARLIGPDKSFSLVSDSPKAEWTKNNFEGFLRRMVDIAGIKGR
jgi:hypothetical protein